MKILITGATGFIGSKVIEVLKQQYCTNDIVALSSSPIDGIKTFLHNDYNFSDDIFPKNISDDIETIIHLGAFIPKTSKDANNISKSNSNIINTQKLLSINFQNLKNIIFASTVDVYDNAEIITESTSTKPVSLYGWSKLYCEKIIESFANEKNVTYQILRIGHVFGEGEERYQKILPITIKKVINNEKIQIWGDGNAIRTFIYNSDVAKSIVNSIKLRDSNIINIVGEEQITINELAKEIINISNKDNIEIEYIPSDIPNRNLIFNNSLLKKTLLSELETLHNGIKKEYSYMEKL